MMTEYERWLKSAAVPESMKAELRGLDEEQIKERFSAPMSFGTAGLRGVMGAGTARMNLFTVRQATQAMAALILREGMQDMGCAVCHDCRHMSREFAVAASEVLSANGVRVYLFEGMRPTPELSFAIRHHGCAAGINITASHNPKQYNGYKVYWADGAQLPPAHADAVAAEMRNIDVLDGAKTLTFERALAAGLITEMGAETDEAYYAAVLSQSVIDAEAKRALGELRVVYTPFHGAGAVPVPEVLRRLGVKKLDCVAEQMVPDGDFSTVESPNPEESAGFELAKKLGGRVGADILIATDPDSDRVGAMCLHGGEYVRVTGNQMGALLADYVLSHAKLPPNAAILKTIVTTNLARAVAHSHGAECIDTFTGFKFMAERIAEFEKTGQYSVLFSFEESYGYMPGTFVRDKDGVAASMLICEMAACHKARGKTLIDALGELYARHGHYAEETVNIKMTGYDAQARMAAKMSALRSAPPESIGGERVTLSRDYLAGTETGANGEARKMELSGSDVLGFKLESGAELLVRPSGTEPKMKVYVLAKGETAEECAAEVERLCRRTEIN